MFVFLAIFIIFLLYINFLLRKNRRAQEDLEKAFWDRERNANLTRRKDISNLNYLTITSEEIPPNLSTDAQKTLLSLCGTNMLNLSGMSNTDLKMEYGVANLETLSACDERFSLFQKNAAIYAQELTDAGDVSAARSLLELAVEHQADNSAVYTQLAALYQAAGEPEKIQHLQELAGKLSERQQQIILSKLQPFLPGSDPSGGTPHCV